MSEENHRIRGILYYMQTMAVSQPISNLLLNIP